MASPVNPPRGMRDFLPADKARREHVLSIIRNSYRSHGFDEIETPVVEDSARLHSGLGGDNEKLAFAVMKRALTTDDLRNAQDPLALADLGLRFDLTVPLARFYASHRGELPNVFRAIQIAPVWRAERPQKGRYRQFVQCDIDIIGEAGPIAEVELITATAATLRSLGITDFTIRINDRRILTSALALLGVAADATDSVLITLDKLDKIGISGVVTELHDNGHGEAVPAIEALLRSQLIDSDGVESSSVDVPLDRSAMLGVVPEGTSPEAIDSLVTIGAAVEATVGAGVVVFDPWLVRGMGYYTGTIFEVVRPELGYSIAGGGRYDGMIGRFLGTDVPAVGFSLGFERFVDLVDLPESSGAEAVALLHDADAPLALLASLQAALVAQGLRVRLERKPRNVAPLLAQLAASGFSRVATVKADSTPETLAFRELA
ncbi:histidyl-tRNA synthetase [Leifsonia sp. AK011]|uniref:histidine--tRNA ligase n=1 Tax=Leifsonia sp. AK011 TaxID=2723075 RepID=UPI0015C9A693|nr:histidine--tRNA ligase [Leifsonia sp. AK011]NYF10080.1 histidyl-tRNA synthetase [Leifsonia sp. AK011]